jgi:hypothetical protein
MCDIAFEAADGGPGRIVLKEDEVVPIGVITERPLLPSDVSIKAG